MVRERGLTAVSLGRKGRVSVLENEVNTVGLLLNKMMSRRCVLARAVSTKKHLFTTNLLQAEAWFHGRHLSPPSQGFEKPSTSQTYHKSMFEQK